MKLSILTYGAYILNKSIELKVNVFILIADCYICLF